MKVVHLSSVHPALDVRIFHKEAKTLSRSGFCVTVIAEYSDARSCVDAISVVGLPKIRSRWLRPLQWARVIYYALRERGAIYHLHDPELLPIGILLQWVTRRPVIYDAHEWYAGKVAFKGWIPSRVRPLVIRLILWLEPLLARQMAAVVTADHLTAEQFGALNVTKTEIIYNYPLREVCSAPRSEYSSVQLRSPRLLYIGGMSASRGIDLMLRMMECLVHQMRFSAHLTLVGDAINPEWRQQVQHRVEELALSEYVRIEGRVPHEQLSGYLADADIGILAYDPGLSMYNIPTKLFEYMAAGLPTVASRSNMTAHFIQAADAGVLIQSQSASEYAQAVVDLCNDPLRLEQLGRNGRRAFETEYNWDSEGSKLVRLYNTILAGWHA